MNLSFLEGEVGADAVRYESAKHGGRSLDDENKEQYYADCQYSQKQAADYLREHVGCIVNAFPDPDATAFERRRYGGFVHVTGRNGSTFVEILESVSPDRSRFDEHDAPTRGLVPAGPEFERVREQYFVDAEVVL